MKKEAQWLLDWFKQHGPVPGSTPEDQLQTDFFDAGMIDSLGVIELILEIEGQFGIQFNERHFQERRFSTIGGLGDMVSELVNHKE